MPRFTHPLLAYVRPAMEGAGLARTLIGLALATAIIFGLVRLARKGMEMLLFGASPGEGLLGLDPAAPAAASDPGSPLGVLLILGAFVAVWPALWVVLPLVHRRSGATLFGPERRLNWRHFARGLAVSLAIGMAAWAPLVARGDASLDLGTAAGVWAIYAAIALPLLFIQCAAEEMLFRGYLLQQFAARSLSVLGWSVLPSVLFAYAHPTGEGLAGISWFHFVFGLIMAAVTSRTGNLGAAIGLHFGNNVVNLLMIAPAQQISGLALIVVPEAVDTSGPRITYLAVMFVGAALFMGLMDFRFIRAWRAQKREEAEAAAAADAAARARDAAERMAAQ